MSRLSRVPVSCSQHTAFSATWIGYTLSCQNRIVNAPRFSQTHTLPRSAPVLLHQKVRSMGKTHFLICDRCQDDIPFERYFLPE